jgi:hypothetical protein
MGFYGALDAMARTGETDLTKSLEQSIGTGLLASSRAQQELTSGKPWYIYWSTLGTQYPFEHVTTADKFVYEAELRTGTGAHYRYAEHLKDCVTELAHQLPLLAKAIALGEAEPE